MRVCPSGCVCQLLRAQGSNVTYAPLVRAGCGALKSGSIRTVPVKYSAGPRAEGSDPLRLSSILIPHDDHFAVAASDGAMGFDQYHCQSHERAQRLSLCRLAAVDNYRASCIRAIHVIAL